MPKTLIQEHLFALQDEEYGKFQRKLMPTVAPERVIGVRTPELRKLAKRLIKEEPEAIQKFVQTLPHTYYEEDNIHGEVIANCKDYDQCVAMLDEFLPYVDNWATCDMIRPKVFAKHLPELLKKTEEWLASEYVYEVRFAIEMLMTFFLDDAFDEKYLATVAAVKSEEYYLKMMVAWYFATALAKQYEATIPYIEEKKLVTWTHNKTIQKAVESYRITQEQKDYLRSLRIK